jgi:hypothetical protein
MDLALPAAALIVGVIGRPESELAERSAPQPGRAASFGPIDRRR